VIASDDPRPCQRALRVGNERQLVANGRETGDRMVQQRLGAVEIVPGGVEPAEEIVAPGGGVGNAPGTAQLHDLAVGLDDGFGGFE